NKPLLEKVKIARENGLPETALDLLIKADQNDLDEPRAVERAGTVVRLLLGMGRVEEAMEALTPDPKLDKPFNKRSFGVDELGVAHYDWFRVQAGAATGNYADADQFLGESIAALEKSPVYAGMLVRLRMLPPSAAQRDLDRSTFVAYLLGDVL